MSDFKTVSEVARELHASPKDISRLFYERALNDEAAPIVGGRRMIPANMVESIRWALVRAKRPVDRM